MQGVKDDFDAAISNGFDEARATIENLLARLVPLPHVLVFLLLPYSESSPGSSQFHLPVENAVVMLLSSGTISICSGILLLRRLPEIPLTLPIASNTPFGCRNGSWLPSLAQWKLPIHRVTRTLPFKFHCCFSVTAACFSRAPLLNNDPAFCSCRGASWPHHSNYSRTYSQPRLGGNCLRRNCCCPSGVTPTCSV
jgi:hypothetical protein